MTVEIEMDDLRVMRMIIAETAKRGAINADEFTLVGGLYDRLDDKIENPPLMVSNEPPLTELPEVEDPNQLQLNLGV